MGEEELIRLDRKFISGYCFGEIEIEQMKTLLLCLKSSKVMLPKYLKMKIFEEKETIFFFEDFFCNFVNGNFENVFNLENRVIGNANLFDQEKELFFTTWLPNDPEEEELIV